MSRLSPDRAIRASSAGSHIERELEFGALLAACREAFIDLPRCANKQRGSKPIVRKEFEMPKISVITDANGKLLAAVRTDAVRATGGTAMQFRPLLDLKIRDLEIDDQLLTGRAEAFDRYLRDNLE
jgi:hypothetical protein